MPIAPRRGHAPTLAFSTETVSAKFRSPTVRFENSTIHRQ
jgi:hypothetical protein